MRKETTKEHEEEKKPISEVLWCDHVAVRPQVDPRAVLIDSTGCFLVAEEGKAKLICKTCFTQGIKLSWPLVN